MHHDGYGVPSDRFDAFLVATRDTFRSIVGEAWTPATDLAWGRMLGEFAAFR
jgi:hypothetical protein